MDSGVARTASYGAGIVNAGYGGGIVNTGYGDGVVFLGIDYQGIIETTTTQATTLILVSVH